MMSKLISEKDSIPRIRINQLLDVLLLVASSENTCTFDQVRRFLHRTSARKAPPSREVMWTAARDVLSDLERCGFLKVGPLPRKRSEVERLQETPCQVTESGEELARSYKENRGKAFDDILLAWLNKHPYFRAFTVRLIRSPMYIPDITSIKQLGEDLKFPIEQDMLTNLISEACIPRLTAIGFPDEKVAVFQDLVEERVKYLSGISNMGAIDAKKLVDAIEDTIVLPAILGAEDFRFDPVTFQHLLSCSRDFYSASVTSSHPDFSGRVLFSTCDFLPDLARSPDTKVSDVIHHGRSFVFNQFIPSLISAYRKLAGSSNTYINIYTLRAIICVDVKIQPLVFNLCLEHLIGNGPKSGVTVYTELPFNPPPQGESYVELGQHRIGLLKLSFRNGG